MRDGNSVDEDTLREFLMQTYPQLVPAIALVSGSRASAEDAVLEALARAWERSKRGEEIESLPAWVTRVALNLSKNRLRRLRYERERGHSISDGYEDPSVEDRVDVRRALAKLPRLQREVTVLRYYMDLDVREVALSLGVSEGTAKTSLFRARRSLARELGISELEEELNDEAR